MTSEAHRVTIDPATDGPPDLPAAPDSGIVLAYLPAESREIWAAHLLEFARQWGDGGRRVLVCDACLDDPHLHRVAAVENGEGISDAVLYGTSIGRIAVEIEGDVMLAPAGTVVAEPAQVLSHPRWSTIVDRADRSGSLVVVAVPAGVEARELEALAAGVVHFESTAAEVASVEAVPVDPGTPTPDAVAAGAAAHRPAAGVAGTTRGARTKPRVRTVRPDRARGRSVGRRGFVVLLVLLAAVALGVAGYFGVIEIPGITPADVDVGALPLR